MANTDQFHVSRASRAVAFAEGAPARGEDSAKAQAGGVSTHTSAAPLASLGTNAKYVRKSQMGTRVQRFALQSAARSILPDSRTAKCLRIRSHGKHPEVWKSIEYGTAQYAGLQTCGSVWACPVCAAKIAERRRVEVLAAMTAHQAQGGCVNMLTLTAPHQRTDNLVDLLAKQAKALGAFWRDRKVIEVFKEMGTIGQIRALETTHGRLSPKNNGWHPHYHVLMFQGSGVDLARFDRAHMTDWQVRLYLRWAACCVRHGLGQPNYKHGIKLDDGTKASKYISKWGLEDEITKGHTKKALHGETPFDLLRAYLADGSDKQAAALFSEFAKAFKGKRQLHWSHGLKARFAIEESSDDQIAERVEERAVLLGALSLDQWRDVLKTQSRATVLEIAASAGWHEVQRFLWFIEGAAKGVQIDPDMLAEARSLLMGEGCT